MGDVGDVAPQRGDAELIGLIVPDVGAGEHPHIDADTSASRCQLLFGNAMSSSDGARYSSVVSPGSPRKCLEQCAQRRDADAARDQRYPPPAPTPAR